MRNAFGTKQVGDFGFGVEFDPDFAETSVSLDQLAVVWTADGGVIAASPLADGIRGSFRMDVARFPSEIDLVAAVNLRRMRELGLPALSKSTHYLTAVAEHSERTRMLALDGERLALDDAVLLEWLINAEKQMLLGTDNHPVFETSLEDTACSIRRLPNGQISMTEVPRQYIKALGTRIRVLAREHPSTHISLCIETPLRCAARYFLTASNEGAETLQHGKSSEVTAFLLMNTSGYSFGLWSPKAGLFSEYAFLAPDDVNLTGRRNRQDPFIVTEPKGAAGNKDNRRIEAYIRKAFDQLLLQMSPEKLENLQLSTYAQVILAAERELSGTIAPIAAEFSSKTGLAFFPLSVPVDEAIAGGLLLGSYSFDSSSVVGAENLPPVNLARDILSLADTEEIERRREEEARLQSRRNRAVITMMAAPVIVAAFMFALVASLLGSYFLTVLRETRADARTQELKPALERRKSYEANLKWYQEFITEVSQLRRQQPVGIGLLYQLNSNYPFAIDPSFYVSDLKLSPVGDVEMKGLARNKDAVASFLKALEFAGGTESGTRLFSNLAYEIQEIPPPATAVGQVKLPTIAGSTLGGNTAVAPGVVRWSIKGNYLPVAGFNPKPVGNQPVTGGQPGAPEKPVPAPAQTAATPKVGG